MDGRHNDTDDGEDAPDSKATNASTNAATDVSSDDEEEDIPTILPPIPAEETNEQPLIRAAGIDYSSIGLSDKKQASARDESKGEYEDEDSGDSNSDSDLDIAKDSTSRTKNSPPLPPRTTPMTPEATTRIRSSATLRTSNLPTTSKWNPSPRSRRGDAEQTKAPSNSNPRATGDASLKEILQKPGRQSQPVHRQHERGSRSCARRVCRQPGLHSTRM